LPHSLLTCAQAGGAPIIEGETATLIWQGAEPPRLAGDFNGWDGGAMPAWERLEPELWACSLTCPRDAYVEYAYFTGDAGQDRVTDPLNPRTTPNGLGDTNSFFYMPEAEPTTLTQHTRGTPKGKLTRHVLQAPWLLTNGKRRVYLYQPPVSEPCPLVIVYDGSDYRQRAKLPVIVDNLIAQHRIRPIALAMVDHGGPARGVEYACSEATVGFVMEHVLPLAEQHLNIIPAYAAAGRYGVIGASAGGRMALFTALRVHHIIGRVLSQAGAFKYGFYETVSFDLVRDGPQRGVQVWLDCGTLDALLDGNHAMAALLAERGYAVTLRTYNAGHNYPAWRDHLAHGLEALYPYAGAD
jgi:enterochelin esterase-like enzyme